MAYVREIKGRYYACWKDPSGVQRSKACGTGKKGKDLANKLAKKIKAELLLGTYEANDSVSWDQFVDEFTKRKLVQKRPRSRDEYLSALENFRRLTQCHYVSAVTVKTVDDFVYHRSREDGKKVLSRSYDAYGRDIIRKEKISPATVNKELRAIRAALEVAASWGYLKKVPEINFLREDLKEPTFISMEEFQKIFNHADFAELPVDPPNGVTPGELMRGLLMFLYMTGWRINQTLQIETEDVDFETGTVFSPASKNKGRRDVTITLHPIVLEYIRPLKRMFSKTLFFWDRKDLKPLYHAFNLIQNAAKVCPKNKRHYTFHDLRRGFATEQAKNLDLFELQRLMQHRSLETTKRYVAMSHRIDTTEKLIVPDVKRAAGQ